MSWLKRPTARIPSPAMASTSRTKTAIRDYVAASLAYRKRDMAAWNSYLDRWVTGVTSQNDYLSKLGADRIAKLANAIHA